MNYMPINTNIFPSYNFIAAENSFLKQDIEYKNAVLCEQQETITKLQADVQSLSQANASLKISRDKALDDAERWRVIQQIIRTQGTDQALYVVQKTVDKEMERVGTGKESVERSNRCSAGTPSYPSTKPNR